MQLSSQIKHQSKESDRLSIFWAIPSPRLFPPLGSGYPLQLLKPFLSQRIFRGFRFYPYCKVGYHLQERLQKELPKTQIEKLQNKFQLKPMVNFPEEAGLKPASIDKINFE